MWHDWTRGAALAATERAQRKLRAHAWPPTLLAALGRLRAGGHQAYLVGGEVRDALLDRQSGNERDVATDLRPEEVMARFARVVPIGLRHGTVLVIEGELRIECTTFRREGPYSDARRPDHVEFSRDPLEDLDRRDLTVNALAFDPESGTLLDPHEGALDLERRRLRAVGEPLARFREDALRPLRAARLAATLELEPDDQLREALASLAGGTSGVRFEAVAQERVRDELERLMAAPHPSVGFELLDRAGLLERWLPELAACRGVPQNRYHAWDVYRHSLYTCDAAPSAKPVVRWAALLHDVGKPATRVERDGEGTFYGHAEVGAEAANRLLERLRFSAAFRERVVHLVREHMFDYRGHWSDAALRRWLRKVGPDAIADLFDLRIADVLGNGLRVGFPVYLETMRERIERLLEESRTLRVTDLEVDGHDVMRELGVGPGRAVRATLERLLEEVLEDPSRNAREHLLARLRHWRASGAPSA
jgi:tRNA nucleotidyltransferase (CCA-adding enzyme)